MNTKTVLLPCPFCGESKYLEDKFTDGWFVVHCDNCGASAPYRSVIHDSEIMAIAWNTRGEYADLANERIDKLRGALKWISASANDVDVLREVARNTLVKDAGG